MDRRRDDRVRIRRECTIYLDGRDEIQCIVRDISEVGIAFEIDYDEQLYESIVEGVKIAFTYLDKFRYLADDKSYIITKECKVARKTKTDKTMIIGCNLVTDASLKEYITCRKVAAFVNKML